METTITENQMEKKMENEMEYIGVILVFIIFSPYIEIPYTAITIHLVIRPPNLPYVV